MTTLQAQPIQDAPEPIEIIEQVQQATTARLRDMIEHGAVVMPITVGMYHQMIDAGILPEGSPYELLDGYIVRKDRSAVGEDRMTVGLDHTWVVKTLADLNPRLKAGGCHMHSQQPVALPPLDEPEPDAAIIRGTLHDYRHHKPGPDDILCIIEVSDASLREDRKDKGRIYAGAGVARYIIINLPDRLVEVHTQPQPGEAGYARCETLAPDDVLELPVAAGDPLSVPVRDLLP